MNEKLYSIGKFAKLIGKSQQTLRNWDKKGILKPNHIAESSYRYYTHDQLNEYLSNNQDNYWVNTEKEFIDAILTITDSYYNKVSEDTKKKINIIKKML